MRPKSNKILHPDVINLKMDKESKSPQHTPEQKPIPTSDPSHPWETYSSFHDNPPIPVFNYVIDNKTLKIIEDLTGKP